MNLQQNMLLKKHLEDKAVESGGSNTSLGTHNYSLRKQVSMSLLLQQAPIVMSVMGKQTAM